MTDRKDVHDRFEPENDREKLLAWTCVAGLPKTASIGALLNLVSDTIRIARLNQPLGEHR